MTTPPIPPDNPTSITRKLSIQKPGVMVGHIFIAYPASDEDLTGVRITVDGIDAINIDFKRGDGK